MNEGSTSRRRFLVHAGSGVGAAWLAAHWSEIAAAHQHARAAAAAGTPGTLQSLTSDEAREIEAVAAQILPADETPGAREAGVLYFIDRALATFARDTRPVYKKGLRTLRGKSVALGAARFSDLPPERQIELLKSIEKTPFFETVRFHTVAGFFGSPEHGGNRDYIGWKLIQFQDEPSFEPPFGYYDAGAGKERE